MSSATKQRFLAVAGQDTPELLTPKNQAQAGRAQSKGDGVKHTLTAVNSDELLPGHPTGKSNSNRKPNLSKLKTKRGSERAKRARTRQEKSGHLRKAEKRGPDEHLTFSPVLAERERMIRVLGRKAINKDRVKLEDNLTREFLRIYKRRRREVQPNYRMVTKERKHGTEAARLCIIKEVTPTQLVDYWVENVGNFTGMRFPSLNFLAVGGNVDRVSVEVAIKPSKRIKRRRGRNAGPEIHAYSGDLDQRLRRGLVEAGIIDGTEFSDRFLMTVQTTAQSLAHGRNLFVSSRLKPMVDWAMENLYGE